MQGFTAWLVAGSTVLAALLTIGFIFARLYKRASAERAFVRTGLGGQRVIMSGGAVVLPIFHETIGINMNTLKLEVNRAQQDSLITKDRMRVDVIVAFFVRVKPTVEGVATAAQTLGQRTADAQALSELTEDKFVDALRSTAATMTMQELQDQREKFVQGVQSTVAEDLAKNGLELESVSLTNLNQTAKEHFNEKNAFDAEGLVKLTQETERRRRERNEIEQDTEVSVREKNRDALQRKLEISQQETFMTLAQEQEVRMRQAEQNAKIASIEAERKREAEQSQIQADRQIKETGIERDQAVRTRTVEAERDIQVARTNQEKITEIAAQDKAIAVAAKSEEQSQAQARANTALAEAVRAEQAVETARKTAMADRDKSVALIDAAKDADTQALRVTTKARADRDAADLQADATVRLANAAKAKGLAEAEVQRALTEAINLLSDAQSTLKYRLALLEALPAVIEKSVEPMKAIDGIKIVQVDGLNRGGDGNGAAGSMAPGGNLAESAVAAALAYRAHAPIIDSLLSEIGLKSGSLANLTHGLSENGSAAPPAMPHPPAA
ncbi:MAG: flotillin family protein [Reyranella sp.]|uniref:flotillin family protein n=1 Tax=Reyranella sp. TaxID=1929291 RepID=UPI001AD41797|nr:flotillin family protein [Reyranella sp.]MBN9090260.1 flotillin family protein [Reyranella sp.]